MRSRSGGMTTQQLARPVPTNFSAPIPEGYLTVKVPTPDGDLEREILHPANPGSV